MITHTTAQSPHVALYYPLLLLPTVLMTIYFSGLTRHEIYIAYTNTAALWQALTLLISIVVTRGLLTLYLKQSVKSSFCNAEIWGLYTLLVIVLPKSLLEWQNIFIAITAILVHQWLRNFIVSALIATIISVSLFYKQTGMALITSSEVFNSYLIHLNAAAFLMGFILIIKKQISWKPAFGFLATYFFIGYLYKLLFSGMESHKLMLQGLVDVHLTFGAFFILPFILDSTKHKLKLSVLAGLLAFLLLQFGHYPQAIAISCLIVYCLAKIDVSAKLWQHDSIEAVLHNPLLPIILASFIALSDSNNQILQNITTLVIIIVLFIGSEAMTDAMGPYIPSKMMIVTKIILIVFLSSYSSLALNLFFPELRLSLDSWIPTVTLATLSISLRRTFMGTSDSFDWRNTLLIALGLLLVGSGMIGLHLLLKTFSLPAILMLVGAALVSLWNPTHLLRQPSQSSTPNRRVRTTGPVK